MCVPRKRFNDDDEDDDEDDDDDDLELLTIQSGKAIAPTITSGLRSAHTDTHTRTQREETIGRAVRRLLLCMRTRHTKRERERQRQRVRKRVR